MPCAVEAVKSGAFDYMLKPFDARAIITRVAKAITSFANRNGHINGTNGMVFAFPGRRCSHRANARCWRRSRPAPRRRKPAAVLE